MCCSFADVWYSAQMSVNVGTWIWIFQVHLLNYAMMRRKACATFGESDDAQITVMTQNAWFHTVPMPGFTHDDKVQMIGCTSPINAPVPTRSASPQRYLVGTHRKAFWTALSECHQSYCMQSCQLISVVAVICSQRFRNKRKSGLD